MNKKKCRPAISLLVAAMLLSMPIKTASQGEGEPREQEFLVTAYYSPRSGQCCYVKGGLRADQVLNGEGHTTADGTPVGSGIMAAPTSYAFGTRIALPSFGTFTVHDRGGAIRELGGGVHRLDIWVGEGEEGLARALAIGARRVRGTVYPLTSRQPEESFDAQNLPAPPERLKNYLTAKLGLMDMHPEFGQRSLSTQILQEHLRALGYFHHAVTGLYGGTTKESLTAFLEAYNVEEPGDHVTEKSAATILAAIRRKNAHLRLRMVGPGSTGPSVAIAQRVLRLLGYYRGRTNGQYDQGMTKAVTHLQMEQGIIASGEERGSGYLGPRTMARIVSLWKEKMVKREAEGLLALHKVDATLLAQGRTIGRFLGEGETGEAVHTLQNILAKKGFFPQEKINGVFGPLTKNALMQYQLSKGLIRNPADPAAGYLGPLTLRTLQWSNIRQWYSRVRGSGWHVL